MTVAALKKAVALTDKPAQAALDTGTATNGLSTYEASRPRHGHPEEEGSWKLALRGRFR